MMGKYMEGGQGETDLELSFPKKEAEIDFVYMCNI